MFKPNISMITTWRCCPLIFFEKIKSYIPNDRNVKSLTADCIKRKIHVYCTHAWDRYHYWEVPSEPWYHQPMDYTSWPDEEPFAEYCLRIKRIQRLFNKRLFGRESYPESDTE